MTRATGPCKRKREKKLESTFRFLTRTIQEDYSLVMCLTVFSILTMKEIDRPEQPRAEFTLISGEKIVYEDFEGMKIHEVFDDLFPRLAVISCPWMLRM